MGNGYDEAWYELHASEIHRERKAMACREGLNNILSMEQKLNILFALQVEKLSDQRVIDMHKQIFGGGKNAN